MSERRARSGKKREKANPMPCSKYFKCVYSRTKKEFGSIIFDFPFWEMTNQRRNYLSRGWIYADEHTELGIDARKEGREGRKY